MFREVNGDRQLIASRALDAIEASAGNLVEQARVIVDTDTAFPVSIVWLHRSGRAASCPIVQPKL